MQKVMENNSRASVTTSSLSSKVRTEGHEERLSIPMCDSTNKLRHLKQ